MQLSITNCIKQACIFRQKRVESKRIFRYFPAGGQSVQKKGKKNGASDRIRTGDSHVGNVILYQLSYTRSSE